jgi:hypothetical protein
MPERSCWPVLALLNVIGYCGDAGEVEHRGCGVWSRARKGRTDQEQHRDLERRRRTFARLLLTA